MASYQSSILELQNFDADSALSASHPKASYASSETDCTIKIFTPNSKGIMA